MMPTGTDASKRLSLRRIAAYVSYQGFAQVLAFASGILVVRHMEKTDYAHYAIAIAFISATALAADAGLNSALMARGSGFWNDRGRLSQLFATGMRFRYRVGLPIALVGACVVWALLTHNGMSLMQVAIVSAIVAATVAATVTTGTLQTFLRLDANFELIQRTGIVASCARFLCVLALVLLTFVNVLTALLVGLVMALVINLVYRHEVTSKITLRAPRDDSDSIAFKVSAKRTLPMVVLLIFSEQLVLVILSLMGTTEIVAEVSALARFNIAFALINMVVADIGAPVVAKTVPKAKVIGRRVGVILAVYAGLAATAIVLVALFASLLLRLLGDNYTGLEFQLVIIAGGAAILNISQAFSSLNQSRGWVRLSWVYIPLIGVWAVWGVLSIDLSTTTGAAIFMATQAIPALLTQIVRFTDGMIRLERAKTP